MSRSTSLISSARKEFHLALTESLLAEDHEIPGNADKSNKTSVQLAKLILKRIDLPTKAQARSAAQTSGNRFEVIVEQFVKSTFLHLDHLRPGIWDVRQVGSRSRDAIAAYAQYAHLSDLQSAAKASRALAAALGNDYTISPDVVITRRPEPDDRLNRDDLIVVDGNVATRSDLRQRHGQALPLLHASISTKWTLRSDRAQNARSEALNLIRNRKGRQPHIVIVSGEPTPSRLASIALGTGDIDCVYHFALNELIAAVDEIQNSEARDLLAIMVDGRRLKDISDLPLDLVV